MQAGEEVDTRESFTDFNGVTELLLLTIFVSVLQSHGILLVFCDEMRGMGRKDGFSIAMDRLDECIQHSVFGDFVLESSVVQFVQDWAFPELGFLGNVPRRQEIFGRDLVVQDFSLSVTPAELVFRSD